MEGVQVLQSMVKQVQGKGLQHLVGTAFQTKVEVVLWEVLPQTAHRQKLERVPEQVEIQVKVTEVEVTVQAEE